LVSLIPREIFAVAFEVTRFFELVEVVVNHGRGRDVAMLADLADGGGVHAFALIGRDKFQNPLVAFAKSFAFSNHHHHVEPPASSLARMSILRSFVLQIILERLFCVKVAAMLISGLKMPEDVILLGVGNQLNVG
jgi:hypothetical protein